jgi:hypothetical protein
MLGDGRTFDSVRVHLYALMCGREKPVIGLNRARLLF